MSKLDLHVHSKGSDGTGSPAEFVAAIQKAGIDGIVLTDHHRSITDAGIEVVAAIRKAGLIGLIGSEYSTQEGHCLVYGVDVAKMKLGFYPPMQKVIDEVYNRGGIAFPSHPYRGLKETLGDRIFQLKNLTHAEAFNGQNEAGNGFASSAKPEANQKAVWAAEKFGLGQTGGSDAHQPNRIGTCFTEFTGTIKTTADFVDALRSKDHTAKVNQAMVEAQRAEAKTWINSPDMKKQRWRETNSGFYEPVKSVQRPRLDEAQVDDYLESLYETDSDSFGDLDGDFVPESAFEEFADVQRFLNLESSRTHPRKPKQRRKRSM